MRGRETFAQAGGAQYDLIPCLNEHPLWLETLTTRVRRFAPGAVPAA
jgi:ferrochelatase